VECEIFGSKYASCYDLLYKDKDYASECERLKQLCNQYVPNARTLLELGSGTGNHSKYLAQMYSVTSVEKSPFMIAIAKKKVAGLSVKILQSDITQLPDFAQKFDICVSMFHVLNYLVSKRAIVSLFQSLKSILSLNGILIFDSWNGLAVLRDRPSSRVKEVRDGDLRVIRIVTPTLRIFDNTCENNYRLLVFRNDHLVDECFEKHIVRYFFPREISEILVDCGYDVLTICNDQGQELQDTDWSMQIIAKPLCS
jgi:SAM-dependent methyltransferase